MGEDFKRPADGYIALLGIAQRYPFVRMTALDPGYRNAVCAGDSESPNRDSWRSEQPVADCDGGV
jgi:hypothetical protein